MRKRVTVSDITLIMIALVMTVVSSNLNWGKDHWKGIIESDGKGYYAYLPAAFIYNDLNFGFYDHIEKEKYYDENYYYDYRSSYNEKVINKYYCGTAIAQAPFFLIAHGAAKLFGSDIDGYSKPYAVAINISGIFYMLLGLYFLNLVLKEYKITEWNRSIVLIATVFGSNLFYYSIIEPAMSHVYSFAFVSMFVFTVRKYSYHNDHKLMYWTSLLFGLIVLIRPVNAIVLLGVPFIVRDKETFKNTFQSLYKNKHATTLGAIIVLIILSIQLLIYKVSTGSFFVYSYGEETFHFNTPNIFNILFSYKKGLFLYTPIYLLSFTGLYFYWKRSKFEFYSWLFFFGAITYILSSWWMWYYGGSFSSRVYVEFLPFFMILLALTINEAKSKIFKTAYVVMIALLIALCQIQTYQYRYFQIHWSDMTKEKYWDVFLRLDQL